METVKEGWDWLKARPAVLIAGGFILGVILYLVWKNNGGNAPGGMSGTGTGNYYLVYGDGATMSGGASGGSSPTGTPTTPVIPPVTPPSSSGSPPGPIHLPPTWPPRRRPPWWPGRGLLQSYTIPGSVSEYGIEHPAGYHT